jgi:hypothetical protein
VRAALIVAIVGLCVGLCASARAAEPEIAFFDTPAEAMKELLRRQPSARVFAFGEVHEVSGAPHATPAIRRFSDEMLATLPAPSELIVETWVEKDTCGKIEHEVRQQVEVMTKRPESTETDIMRLLRLGKARGLRPHILSLSCETYRSLQGKDGQLDAVALLGVVTTELQKQIVGLLGQADPIVVYGGALHNDRAPRKELAQFSFARAVDQAAHGRYLEIDLYVPEYIEADQAITATGWYQRYASTRKAHPSATALVRAAKGSYVFLFPRAISAAPPSAAAPR